MYLLLTGPYRILESISGYLKNVLFDWLSPCRWYNNIYPDFPLHNKRTLTPTLILIHIQWMEEKEQHTKFNIPRVIFWGRINQPNVRRICKSQRKMKPGTLLFFGREDALPLSDFMSFNGINAHSRLACSTFMAHGIKEDILLCCLSPILCITFLWSSKRANRAVKESLCPPQFTGLNFNQRKQSWFFTASNKFTRRHPTNLQSWVDVLVTTFVLLGVILKGYLRSDTDEMTMAVNKRILVWGVFVFIFHFVIHMY